MRRVSQVICSPQAPGKLYFSYVQCRLKSLLTLLEKQSIEKLFIQKQIKTACGMQTMENRGRTLKRAAKGMLKPLSRSGGVDWLWKVTGSDGSTASQERTQMSGSSPSCLSSASPHRLLPRLLLKAAGRPISFRSSEHQTVHPWTVFFFASYAPFSQSLQIPVPWVCQDNLRPSH